MRILAVLPHYLPDTAPTGVIGTRLVTELGHLGVDVEVVTSLPWYSHHAVEATWQGGWRQVEQAPYGRIQRIHPFPTGDRRNIPARAVGFAGFCAATAAVGAAGAVSRRHGRVDAVLAMTPPLPMGTTGWLVSLARRAPLVLNVQDVFPDVAVELGVLTGERKIAAARALERWTYGRASAVTVLSDDMRENIAAKTNPQKVHVIPNFVDTASITPAGRDTDYRREHDLGDATVVMYAGNVGMSQSVELLVEAARSMVERRDVLFVVNGGGSGLDGLKARAGDLPNVRFVPIQPVQRLPEVLASADLHVVPLRTGLARASVPSKIYSILAAGRPVLASVDRLSEIERIITEAGAGAVVGPDDQAAFTEQLSALLAPGALDGLGMAGRRWVEAAPSPVQATTAYAHLLERVVAENGPRRLRHPRR